MAGGSAFADPWSEAGLERSVVARFEEVVDDGPSALALGTRGEMLTYDDLDRWANRIASAALETRGDRLEPMALLPGRRTAAIAGTLGAWKAGKICVYLDAALPRERLRFLLEDSGAGLVAGEGGTLPLARVLAEEIGVPLIDVEARDPGPTRERRPGIHVPPAAPAQITYTSGSTGLPRGVVSSHRHLLWSCRPGEGPGRMGPGDRVLLAASPGAGQALGIFLALLNGGAVFPVDIESEGLPALRDRIAGDGITVYHSVPAVFRALVKRLREGERFPGLRLVRLGGDTVRRGDVELFQRHFEPPCLLRVGYGCTEAGPIAGHFLDATTPLPDGPVPVGRPYPGLDVRLLDASGREVGTNEIGEITVRSRYLALGYWSRGALASELTPDPSGGPERVYGTGDLGRFRPDGLLVHLGRRDDQVEIRGNRVEVGEVEAALRALPGLEDAAVAAHPGSDGESRLVGYVVWKGRRVSARELRAGLSRTLPHHMVPAAFVSLPSLPLTARGKVDRSALGPPVPERPADEGGLPGPRSEVERELVVLWEELLEAGPVGVRDDFFELGGDSLLAVELFALIERRMGRYLPLSSFVQASTIELLARRLLEAPPARWPCLVPMQTLGSLPPFYCVSWAEGEVLAYSALAARLGPGRPFYGLRRDRLEDHTPRYTRVEDMAAQYVEEVVAFQPKGPYLVGGLSGGAVVAFEMARQLRAAGHEVGALVLMEPPRLLHRNGAPDAGPGPGALRRLRALSAKAGLYPTKWRLLAPKEKVADLRGKAVRLWRRIARSGGVLSPGRVRAPEADWHGADVAPDLDLKDVEPYFARPCAGGATLILASHEGFRRERIEYWRSMVPGGLDVRVVPGVHAAIVQEPFVRVLARELEECLRAGEGEP